MASEREIRREKAKELIFQLLEATDKASDLKSRIGEAGNGGLLAERRAVLQKIDGLRATLSALGFELFSELIRSEYDWLED